MGKGVAFLPSNSGGEESFATGGRNNGDREPSPKFCQLKYLEESHRLILKVETRLDRVTIMMDGTGFTDFFGSEWGRGELPSVSCKWVVRLCD